MTSRTKSPQAATERLSSLPVKIRSEPYANTREFGPSPCECSGDGSGLQRPCAVCEQDIRYRLRSHREASLLRAVTGWEASVPRCGNRGPGRSPATPRYYSKIISDVQKDRGFWSRRRKWLGLLNLLAARLPWRQRKLLRLEQALAMSQLLEPPLQWRLQS